MDREGAVVLAYRSMSAVLAARLDLAADTHWERLRAAERAGLDEDALAALERLTRVYERAAYAPGVVDTADSRWAIGVATRVTRRLR